MQPIDIAEQYEGKTEKANSKELDAFILKHVPAWKGLTVKSTAWCAAFMGACIGEAGGKGTGKLNARSYVTWGTPIKIENAQIGDTVVFKRGTSGWEGHVTFINSLIKDKSGKVLGMYCLGGNQFNPATRQSDIVNVEKKDLTQLIGIRRGTVD